MKRILLLLTALGVVFALVLSGLPKRTLAPTPLEQLRENFPAKQKLAADHTKFAVLQGPFATPQEVTAACISCHNERHSQVMKSSHWNWERLEYIDEQGIRKVGKKNILNNFCVGISGNEQTCNKCHIGFGWNNSSFDFDNANNVDCLACHDNSNTYVKQTGGAGMPDASVDLSVVAQHVGQPDRDNCGACHFFGGGGNNVKHGDLEMALFEPSREIDVHMGIDGLDMSCVACHTAEDHQMLGKLYSVSSMNRNRVQCETCHTPLPHADAVLNKHTVKVSCQACHIPVYAKENPTKLFWDWSTAGRLKDGEPYEEEDSTGTMVYSSKKGSFIWRKNVEPEYVWFNGRASHYLIGDVFDPNDTLKINTLHGTYDDPNAKIIPVKVHRTKQIYDAENNYLIQPKTVSTEAGDGGYWKEFDWQKAATAGMEAIDLPFSGKYDFANTEMYWPINHMISPAAEAVACTECHSRTESRLAGLEGFYMPRRDTNPWVERAGSFVLMLTLLGVLAHGGTRFYLHRRRKTI